MTAQEQLNAAVIEAIPLIKFFENRLASSLSCDSRSHDNDREPRRQLNAILDAAAKLQAASAESANESSSPATPEAPRRAQRKETNYE